MEGQQPVAIFVAQPPYREPMVALSPEEHGYGENIDGRPAPRDNIKFEDGRYEAFDETMADILRKHTGNTANGGETFFEIPSEVTRHARALDGTVAASMPEGGLTGEDQQLVNALAKLASKNLPPPAAKGAVDKMRQAVERFRVSNFDVPSAERKLPIIKGRVAELVELLEEQGIKTEHEQQ